MKKTIILLFLVISLCLIGCDLNFLSGTVYFYNLAGEGDEPSNASLRYRKDGYTIIMSRGKGDESGWPTEEGAEGLKNDTTFTLTLNKKNIIAANDKSIEDLGGEDYHIVQSFELDVLAKGTYTLVGRTDFSSTGGFRNNIVTLTIK